MSRSAFEDASVAVSVKFKICVFGGKIRENGVVWRKGGGFWGKGGGFWAEWGGWAEWDGGDENSLVRMEIVPSYC